VCPKKTYENGQFSEIAEFFIYVLTYYGPVFAEVAGHFLLTPVVKLDLPIAVELTGNAELAVWTLPTLYF
jgi:hypothetical protein